MEIYYALIGVFGAVLTGALLIYEYVFGDKIKIAKRVSAVVGQAVPVPIRQQELSAPLYQRVIKPALNGLGRILSKSIPAAREASLAKKLIEAGNPGNLAPREVMVLKYLTAGGTAFGLWLMAQLINKTGAQCVIFAIAGFILGWLIPDLVLNSKIRERKGQIEKSLPDVLDLLTVSVEAGLGFDGAVLKVVEKSKSVLAGEFMWMLQEIKMGKPRREALRDMSDRIAVDDVSNFVGSVIMADQLGVSIGNVLRIQSKDVREKRKQRIEEQAMKAPIKMLFPLVFFIFPAIFIVLLGPALIQIMRVFK